MDPQGLVPMLALTLPGFLYPPPPSFNLLPRSGVMTPSAPALTAFRMGQGRAGTEGTLSALHLARPSSQEGLREGEDEGDRAGL